MSFDEDKYRKHISSYDIGEINYSINAYTTMLKSIKLIDNQDLDAYNRIMKRITILKEVRQTLELLEN